MLIFTKFHKILKKISQNINSQIQKISKRSFQIIVINKIQKIKSTLLIIIKLNNNESKLKKNKQKIYVKNKKKKVYQNLIKKKLFKNNKLKKLITWRKLIKKTLKKLNLKVRNQVKDNKKIIKV